MALAAVVERIPLRDPLWTVQDVATRLNVTKDWVWDHSSRKGPVFARDSNERWRTPLSLKRIGKVCQ